MKQMISMKYLRSGCLVGDESRLQSENCYLFVCFEQSWFERHHGMMRNY
jgi:hypothetical protein